MDKYVGFAQFANMFCGYGQEKSAEAFNACVGKTITALELRDKYEDGEHFDGLYFTFEDGSRMKLSDEGQDCCEFRYMQTDDELPYFVGSKLVGVEVADGPDIGSGEDDAHETAFLRVTTDRGVFTIVTHNENNGYYGGFAVRAAIVKDEASPLDSSADRVREQGEIDALRVQHSDVDFGVRKEWPYLAWFDGGSGRVRSGEMPSRQQTIDWLKESLASTSK